MPAVLRRLSPEARAYVGLCLATLCWASAFIAGKLVLAEITPLSAAGLRHLAAMLLLAPFAWRRRGSANLRAAAVPLAIIALCGGVMYQWVFMAALQRTSATNTSLLIALNPAITFLFAPLVGESYTRGGLLGIALALTGAVLVITHGDLAVLGSLDATRLGDLLALFAAVLWAIFNLASRRVVLHVPHSLTNTVTYGVGSLVLLLLATPEAPVTQLAQASWTARGALLTMVIFSSVAAGQLFLHGVHTVGVSRTVVFVYLIPVVTAALSALLLGESLLPAQVIGGAAVLAGVYVTTRGAVPPQRKMSRVTTALPHSHQRDPVGTPSPVTERVGVRAIK
jgi:drug/metabolite transporter (DMT)-like permease